MGKTRTTTTQPADQSSIPVAPVAPAEGEKKSKGPYVAFGTYPKVMKILSDPALAAKVLREPRAAAKIFNDPSEAIIMSSVDLKKTILNSYIRQIAKKTEEESANLMKSIGEIETNIGAWIEKAKKGDLDAKGYSQLYTEKLNLLRPTATERMKERDALTAEIKALVKSKDELFAKLNANESPENIFNDLRNKADALSVKLNGLMDREKAAQYDLSSLERQSRPAGQKITAEAPRPQLGNPTSNG